MSSTRPRTALAAQRRIGGLVLVALVACAQASAQEVTQRVDSARATRLRGLANEAFSQRAKPARPANDEATAALEALDALQRDIAKAERQPLTHRLRAVADRRQKAERAITNLRTRMAERSTTRADALAESFAPVWSDVDAALTAPPSRRRERLAAARERLERARTRRGETHSNTLVIQPFGIER
jgi:hypothetical protein